LRALIVILLLSNQLLYSQDNKSKLFGFATSNTFTYCDLEDTVFLNKVIDLKPKLLRFPGGAVGNYYHFGGEGYGFDFKEIEKYDAGKFLKRSKGLARDAYKKGHTHDYIDDFIILAKATDSQVILVANMFVDNDDIIKIITKILANDIEIIGVELGSELTNRYFFEKGYTIDDYLIASKRYSDIVKLHFPEIKTAIVAAPLGKEKNHRHNIWNNKLAALDYYDAVIVHSYAKVIKGKNLFGQMIIEEDEGLSKEEVFNIYKSRVFNFFINDFPDEIKRYNTIFNKPIWITEWNLQMSKTTGNTMLQSLFVSNYFLELLSNKDLDNISITTYHNLGGRDYSGSIFSTNTGSLEIRSAYYPLKMIGELFSISGQIKVERKELKQDVFKYLIYNEKQLVKIIILNWSDNGVVTNNDISKQVQVSSYYSPNLYDKADIYGKLSMERMIVSAKSDVILKPYSVSLISFDNE